MSHLNNRPVRWQRSSTYNHPFLFVIPSVRWAFGPPKVMKNFTGNYFLWSRFHFLVIPTGAKRSGGTCGSADPSLRCFSTERSAPHICRIIEGFTARSRRTSAMLVDRCSSELSGHKLQRKLKSQAPSGGDLSRRAVEESAVLRT